MNRSDLSAPPSPTSDSSSSPESPIIGATIEPMDLTGFIGSLNESNEKEQAKKREQTKHDRQGSFGARNGDDNGRQKEWRKLLDRDYQYRESCSDVCG